MIKYRNHLTDIEKNDLKNIIDNGKEWYQNNMDADEKAFGEKQKFIYELMSIYKQKYTNPMQSNI